VSAPLIALKELGSIHTGSTPKTNDDSLFGGDVPFVTPSDLGEVGSIQITPRTLTEAGVQTADLLPAESVLVCCIGSLGKIGFAGRPLVTNQQINAVVFNSAKVYARYGYYACRMLKPKLELMAPATTVPIVNKTRFSELKIPVPPLEEQRRIAAILDQAETLRTQRRAALAQLDSLTQSIFLDMFGDPRNNPKAFPRMKLGELIDKGPQNGLYKSSTEYGSGTPILRIDAFYDGVVTKLNLLKRVRLSSDEIELFGLALEDIVINRVNSIEYLGKSALIPPLNEPTVFESNMMRFSVQINLLRPDYLVHFLQTPYVKSQILSCSKNAVNQSSINQQDVKGFLINVPPLELQRLFALIIQSIETLQNSQRKALAELDTLFASLQQRAFKGTL
jgi:type I restriction enzyme, S subunit